MNWNQIKTGILSALIAIVCFAINYSREENNLKGENPRGIYKMTALVGKQGEVAAPYEQYKICTDSVTLHCSVSGREFFISKNDETVFNYTGDTPKSPTDKRSLIYDSNHEHFTLKWWSRYSNHIHFPSNDWCLEKYQSGVYSANARPFFDAITGVIKADDINPFIGTWQMIRQVDNLDEHATPTIGDEPWHPSFVIFTPKHIVMTSRGNGIIFDALYSERNAVIYNTLIRQVKWLADDCIAIAYNSKEGTTHYEILQRVNDEVPVLQKIAGLFMKF